MAIKVYTSLTKIFESELTAQLKQSDKREKEFDKERVQSDKLKQTADSKAAKIDKDADAEPNKPKTSVPSAGEVDAAMAKAQLMMSAPDEAPAEEAPAEEEEEEEEEEVKETSKYEKTFYNALNKEKIMSESVTDMIKSIENAGIHINKIINQTTGYDLVFASKQLAQKAYAITGSATELVGNVLTVYNG